MIDKKRSVLNIVVSILFKFLLLISAILVKRLLIQYIGNDINGLNSLYRNIIGFLSVAELGIGTAISFAMYKPIVNRDEKEVAALYILFKKAYIIIGAIIAILGITAMPFLPLLTKEYSSPDVNLYFTFVLMLISVVISYTFSAKVSLINAYKNNYITTAVHSACTLIQYILQGVAIIFTRSFTWFLLSRIVAVGVHYIIISLIAKKMHSSIINSKAEKISPESKILVKKNIKALFIHKVGEAFVNSTDSIIISAFVGVAMLGKYSNYATIAISMFDVIVLIFTPLTSIIGHLFVSNAKEAQKYYNFFFALNFSVGALFFFGYYAVIDSLVFILFGRNLQLSSILSFTITLNYFLQFMRQSTLLFRNATGTFYHDRWKPFFEAVLNIVLSIAFVMLFSKLFGEDMGVVGILLATIITNLFICHIVEPYVLYKHAFNSSMKKHMIKVYVYIALFIALLIVMNFCLLSFENKWKELVVNGVISVAFSAMTFIVVILTDKDFKHYIAMFLSKMKKKITNRSS